MHWVLTMQQVKHLRFIITLGLQSNLEKEAFPLLSFYRWGIRAFREGVSCTSQSWRRVVILRSWVTYFIIQVGHSWEWQGVLWYTRAIVRVQDHSCKLRHKLSTTTYINSVCVCVCVCVYLMHLFLINQLGQMIKDELSRHFLLGWKMNSLGLGKPLNAPQMHT